MTRRLTHWLDGPRSQVGSGLIWVALSFVLGIAPFVGTEGNWLGVHRHTAQLAIDALTFVGPLALAAGAWQGVRVSRSQRRHLMHTAGRPLVAVYIRLLARTVGPVVVGWSLVVSVVVARTSRLASYGGVPVFWLTLGVLSIVTVAILGLALGIRLPHPATVAGSLIAAILIPYYLVGASGDVHWSNLATPDQLAIGTFRRTSSYFVFHTAWLVALIVASFALILRRKTIATYGVLASVGIAIALVQVPPLEADMAAQEPYCEQGGTIEICTTRQHAYLVDDLTPVLSDFDGATDALIEVRYYHDLDLLGDTDEQAASPFVPTDNRVWFPRAAGNSLSADVVDRDQILTYLLGGLIDRDTCPLAISRPTGETDTVGDQTFDVVVDELTAEGELVLQMSQILGVERFQPGYASPLPPRYEITHLLPDLMALDASARQRWLAELWPALACTAAGANR